MAAAEPSEPDFVPRFPWLGADLQTLRDFLVQPREPVPAATTETREFPMPDGSGDRLIAELDTPRDAPSSRPLAVLVHGLTGCSDSFYIRRAARAFLQAGFPVLRLNLRGAGPSRAQCRFQYHSGRSEDLHAVLGQLRTDRDVVLIGWSLGANMLLKALAELSLGHRVRGAVAVSTPIDLAMTARRFQAPRNWPYHRWMLRRMKQEALDGSADVDAATRRRLADVRTVIEFDDVFTAPRNGFAGAADYYARCSALRFLPEIRVPTLVIQAFDDPWIPAAMYRRVDWPSLGGIETLFPATGGHVGFHARGGGVWSDARAVGFLSAR